jgi:hypothetical protein
VDLPTVKSAPPVGDSWTDSLEGTVGVATHHDGMSGTERQDVSDDYEQRISESHKEAEAGVALSLKKLLGLGAADSLDHCGCNAADSCLNISVCAATTGKDEFSVVAWNPQGHNTTQTVRIPVSDTGYAVTGPAGTVISQILEIDERTKSLPLLYLNSHNMTSSAIAKANATLSNKATHILTFQIEIPAVGYSVYAAKKVTMKQCEANSEGVCAVQATRRNEPHGSVSAESDMYSIQFDNSTGLVTSITNKVSGITTPFSIEWGWYNSSVGGCTDLSGFPAGMAEKSCDNQKSGAYIFRPNSSKVFYPGPKAKPTLTVVTGPVVTEIYQRFSDWATHVIRLYQGQPYIEVEWTAGPVPVDTPWFPPATTDNGHAREGRSVVCKDVATGVYKIGQDNSNDCPKGAAKISYNDCSAAVKEMSLGFDTKNSTNPIDPGGCFLEDKKGGRGFYRPPLFLGNLWGKEVIVKYTSGIKSAGTWYTDSNGKEMVKRVYNKRGPSYPEPYKISEPVAGNYYPVNALMSLDDGKNELTVLTDVSQGGASLADGELEFMLHRRVLQDDSRGVQEPLNETMCGCNDVRPYNTLCFRPLIHNTKSTIHTSTRPLIVVCFVPADQRGSREDGPARAPRRRWMRVCGPHYARPPLDRFRHHRQGP